MSQHKQARFATCLACRKAVSTRPQFHELTRTGERVHPRCYMRLARKDK